MPARKRRKAVPLRPKSSYPTAKVADCIGCGEPIRLVRKGDGRRRSRYSDSRDYWWTSDGDHDCEEARQVRAGLKRTSERIRERLRGFLAEHPLP